jgi:hypothetical protein
MDEPSANHAAEQEKLGGDKCSEEGTKQHQRPGQNLTLLFDAHGHRRTMFRTSRGTPVRLYGGSTAIV